MNKTNITFEIPFDSIIYNEQNKLLFDAAWSKILKQRKQHLITGSILTILGIAIIIGKDNIGYILVAFGFLALIFFYRLNNHYQTNKEKFFATISENIVLNQKYNEMNVWELNEDYFRYKDFKIDAKMEWIAFSGYRLINDTIFIDSNVGICFILSKNEIDSERFNNVIDLLDGKLKKTCG